MPVPVLVSVMVAPATVAPDWSVMVPRSEAVVCAEEPEQKTVRRAKAKTK
jgi:hypothetical protein